MKGCLGIILGILALIWAYSDPTSFLITLGIFVGIVIIIIIVESNKPKPIKANTDFPKVSYTTNNFYNTDFDFVERLYDIEISNPDFHDIALIQYEDDEIMERLEEKIADFKIISKEDLYFWYETEEKWHKTYTDKYLKRRFRRKMQEEYFI
jgi:hypothetical protein